MNMETIKDLNSKWWYRLLKVAVIVSFLISFLVYSDFVYDIYSPQYDNVASNIECANGKVFYLEEWGFYAGTGRLSVYGDNRAKEHCLYLTTENELDLKNALKDEETRPTLDMIFGGYTLNIVYEERKWFLTIVGIIGVFILHLIVFEIVRRIWYYIVLGSIRPKKE